MLGAVFHYDTCILARRWSGRKPPTVVESLRFLKQFVRDPGTVGSITPSSRHLALELAAPFSKRRAPARVLEVGAGTGAVTRHLADMLGPADTLDICEIDPALAGYLEDKLIAGGPLKHHHADGRVRMLTMPIQQIDPTQSYDYIISGLPLTAFEPGDVKQILGIIQSVLSPGGVFSYFEYSGIRAVMSTFCPGATGRRVRAVSAILTRQIRSFQVRRKTVIRNIPPAVVRHWQFTTAPSQTAAA